VPLFTFDVESTRATIVGVVDVDPPPVLVLPPPLLVEPEAIGERLGEVGEVLEQAPSVATDASSRESVSVRPDIFFFLGRGLFRTRQG